MPTDIGGRGFGPGGGEGLPAIGPVVALPALTLLCPCVSWRAAPSKQKSIARNPE